MRRLALTLLVLLMGAGSTDSAFTRRSVSADGRVQVTQTPTAPTDAIARLLLGLERAIGGGRVEEFRAIASPTIPHSAVDRFTLAVGDGPNARAVVRERQRRPKGAGYDVVIDVLVSRGTQGRIATWLLAAVPDETASGLFKVADLHELAFVGGLLRLRLDTSRQFDIKDLTVNAPDLVMTFASGSAFVAESPSGVTGLVLRGKGVVHFSPSDPAEQLQLRIFSHRPVFRTEIDTVFVRISPLEFAQRISTKNLTPGPVNPAELARAQQVFDDYAPRTYNLDVRALTTDRWSLEPTFGSLVLEFHTSRNGWLTYTRSPSEPEDISLFDRAGGHNICLYSSATKAGARARAFSDDDGSAYDVENYGLDLAFDPARTWINGRGSLSVRISTESAATITIRLAQSLAVASVSSPELGELLALRVIGQNNVLIGLPASMKQDTRFTFDVTYAGRLPPQPIDREAIMVQGAQGQGQTPPEDQPIITPEPRFMYSNRVQWYPQGVVSDYATARLRLAVPAVYQVVATGKQIGSSMSSVPAPPGPPGAAAPGSLSMRTTEFVADRPVRYLSCLISKLSPVGRLVVDVPRIASAEAGELAGPPTAVNLEVVATSRMAARNRQTPARAAAMLRFFATTIGEAPYPNLTIAALDDNLPGGHSPAYLVALHQALPTTPYSWSSDPVAFENQFPDFFLAHEMAHQWWGQAVGWRNYHEQWLSEGLAQYFAVLFAAEDRGPALLQSLIATMRNTSQPVLAQGPISLGYRIGHIHNDTRAFRSILYNKAAVVLHMLRRFIGDEAFFAGIRRFYADWRFKKAGADQLQAAFEAGTPQKLDRFFAQWIRGFTVPKIRLTWRAEDEGKTGMIKVEQTGETFDFPLTVVLQFRDGRSEERTLKVVGPVFEVRVAAALRRVTIRDSLSYFEEK